MYLEWGRRHFGANGAKFYYLSFVLLNFMPFSVIFYEFHEFRIGSCRNIGRQCFECKFLIKFVKNDGKYDFCSYFNDEMPEKNKKFRTCRLILLAKETLKMIMTIFDEKIRKNVKNFHFQAIFHVKPRKIVKLLMFDGICAAISPGQEIYNVRMIFNTSRHSTKTFDKYEKLQ